MQNDLNLKDWIIDERTGYLRHPTNQRAITPEQKETFLEGLKTLGNEAKAAKLAGFNPRVLSTHKRADRKFREDWELTIQAMANVLEGVMYLNAQEPRGTLDRFGWLRAHFPKKWNPKFIDSNDKDQKKVIDELWEEVHKEKGK